MLQCTNSPQGANKYTNGFLCCDLHVRELMRKGLKAEKINLFINWDSLIKEYKKSNEKLTKLQKKPSLNHKIIESTKIKIEKIEKSLKSFVDDDIQAFRSIKQNGKVIRRSNRINDKTHAKLNESLEMLKDTAFLEKVEIKLGEANVSPELIQHQASMFIDLHHLSS